MKKILILITAVITLAACNSKNTNNEQHALEQAAVETNQNAVDSTESAMMLAQLDSVRCSCIVLKDGVTTRYTQSGVRDLYELVTTKSEVLRGAHVADKIIGKGAAALMVNGKINRATTHTITTPALKMLSEAGVAVYFENEIPFVENRKKTGQCPLDARLQEVDSAAQAMPVIEQFIKDLNDGKIF